MLSKILSQGSRLVALPVASGPLCAVLLPLVASMLLNHALDQLLDE